MRSNRKSAPRRRRLVPEVVQTSAMDCGPATLKCLLEGFGIEASYDRLREACQTDVDGTSIDTLEVIANQLGLDAEQVMLPLDHLPIPEAEALPALVVVRQPIGTTHFVVVWSRVGEWVQVMDPAVGRRWARWSRLREEVFVHTLPVPAADWREWAGTPDFLRPLERRLTALGGAAWARGVVESALADAGWRSLGALDAAARMVQSLVDAGAMGRGRAAARLVETLRDGGLRPDAEPAIPPVYCSVRPAPAEEGEDLLWMRGAVLVRVRGRRETPAGAGVDGPLPGRELSAALAAPRPRPLRDLVELLRVGGSARPGLLLGAAAAAAGGSIVEALALRGALELGAQLGLVYQRLAAVGSLLVLLLALLALEMGLVQALARLGRRLEVHLRMRVLERIPRIHSRYFRSRPVSDMAERSHAVHHLRALPRWLGQTVRVALQLLFTVGAIAWCFPEVGHAAALAGAVAVGLPLAMLPLLNERDLRVRTHVGALARFQLDSLQGLAMIRAHCAEGSVLREHDGLLVEWVRAARARLRAVTLFESVQALAGIALAAWTFALYAAGPASAGGALLLAYWVLALPQLGGDLARLLGQLPHYRNVTLRLLEPLGAPGTAWWAAPSPASGEPDAAPGRGVGIRLEGVSVAAGGHAILEELTLEVEPGEHVAIVGSSGAGKSSLLGLLLGWHAPDAGRVLVDGRELTAERCAGLRQETAWLDPAVYLWNRSLLDNIAFGAEDPARQGLGAVLTGAELIPVVDRLGDGLQSRLGEGGGLLSGGEGQRVRYARAMLRRSARLAVLDEPYRGLDREQRQEFLARARSLWRDATLLCVTHDIRETTGFDRVVVIEGGRVVADGPPDRLRQDPGSRYRALLDAEEAALGTVWGDAGWTRLRLEAGQLAGPPAGGAA